MRKADAKGQGRKDTISCWARPAEKPQRNTRGIRCASGLIGHMSGTDSRFIRDIHG
jgi:hypothetical protein